MVNPDPLVVHDPSVFAGWEDPVDPAPQIAPVRIILVTAEMRARDAEQRAARERNLIIWPFKSSLSMANLRPTLRLVPRKPVPVERKCAACLSKLYARSIGNLCVRCRPRRLRVDKEVKRCGCGNTLDYRNQSGKCIHCWQTVIHVQQPRKNARLVKLCTHMDSGKVCGRRLGKNNKVGLCINHFVRKHSFQPGNQFRSNRVLATEGTAKCLCGTRLYAVSVDRKACNVCARREIMNLAAKRG